MQVLAISDGMGSHTDLTEISREPAYVENFDIEANHGRGAVMWTRHAHEAYTWPSAKEALEDWNRQSETLPLRPDGRPNKPMTAMTIAIVSAPKDASS
jgi:hypothetical protein